MTQSDLAGQPIRLHDSVPVAERPMTPGPLSYLGILWSLLLIGLGAVGIRDALVYADVIDGDPWVESLAKSVDKVSPADWMVAAGVGAILVGVVLVVVALRPRPRTALRVQARTGIFISPKGIARLAEGTAERVNGVDTAEAAATLKRVTVTISTWSETPDELQEVVAQAVRNRLSRLAAPPPVRVELHKAGGSS